MQRRKIQLPQLRFNMKHWVDYFPRKQERLFQVYSVKNQKMWVLWMSPKPMSICESFVKAKAG